MNTYCRFCCNAGVEPKLDSNNDLSYMCVGKSTFEDEKRELALQ